MAPVKKVQTSLAWEEKLKSREVIIRFGHISQKEACAITCFTPGKPEMTDFLSVGPNR
jgi:hypothetical protein